MTGFDDVPTQLPAFEPRFPVRRLIVDRGSVYGRAIRDSMTGDRLGLLDSVGGRLRRVQCLSCRVRVKRSAGAAGVSRAARGPLW